MRNPGDFNGIAPGMDMVPYVCLKEFICHKAIGCPRGRDQSSDVDNRGGLLPCHLNLARIKTHECSGEDSGGGRFAERCSIL